nr:23S rRNA (uracil(1939)-C(5))-methyltransferase RlmD [uncultured Dethiosulfovibrio sp.]
MKELILKIRDINSTGQGVALSEEGKVIFVDGALPGERVLVSMIQEKKNYGKARMIEIETPSDDRVTPKCPWFGSCGGCQIQHGSYGLQISLKEAMVKSTMGRIGGVDVGDVICVPSERRWGYRNKASFPVRSGKEGGIGFFRPNTHSVVPIDRCPILKPEIDGIYSAIRKDFQEELSSSGFFYNEKNNSGFLRHIVARSNESNDLILMLVVSSFNKKHIDKISNYLKFKYSHVLMSLSWNLNDKKSNRIIGDNTFSVWGKNLISERLGDFSFVYDGTAFFQVNTLQAENLFELASEWAASPEDRVVELYSGVGALTSYLSKNAKSVLAVEEWRPSVERLEENMFLNGIGNVNSLCGKAEELIKAMIKEKPKVVVVDPPRTGCAPEVLSAITESVASKLVYVSCNPATLARDTAILIKAGWNLSKLRSFDLFPQTCHVETVVLFIR